MGYKVTYFPEVGTRYGKLVLIEPRSRTSKMVLCQCDCGQKKWVNINRLKSGTLKSCGCLQITRNMTTEEKFWFYVDITSSPHGCWLWQGGKTEDGYGHFLISGYKTVRAHRWAYEHFIGLIPENYFVCHNCPGGDNPSCVNWRHLFAGSHQDNMSDMVQKGRSLTGEKNPQYYNPDQRSKGDNHWTRLHPEKLPRGDKHYIHSHPEAKPIGIKNPRAKLTEIQVREIRELSKQGLSSNQIAKLYSISGSVIRKIISLDLWKHVA